jgi:hypothetical protein
MSSELTDCFHVTAPILLPTVYSEPATAPHFRTLQTCKTKVINCQCVQCGVAKNRSLSCTIYADPKQLKRQRNREYYAKNKDEIAKRRRQARELKKQSTSPDNDENMICDTPVTGQSGVTQTYRTPAGGTKRQCLMFSSYHKHFDSTCSYFV